LILINTINAAKIKATKKINRDKLSDLDKAKIKEIEALLGKSIVGFSSFQNFKLSTKKKVGLRFQYNYDADYEGGGNKIYFIGVGYILVNELLVGFKPAPKQIKEPTKADRKKRTKT
jgi:hypothetical protein